MDGDDQRCGRDVLGFSCTMPVGHAGRCVSSSDGMPPELAAALSTAERERTRWRVGFDARNAPNLTMATVDVFTYSEAEAEMEVRAAFGIDVLIGRVHEVGRG